MTDDRKTGITFVIGSLGGMATMAVHPTAARHLTDPDYERLALVSGVAHTIGIASVAILFLGACGLTLRLRTPDRVSHAGLVAFGVAGIAAIIAAAISGFIEPGLMLQMVRDVPGTAAQWRIVITAIFQVNQAMARIFVVASSIAVILWSVAALRNARLGRTLSIYGCVIPSLLILGVSIGHLRMDVHGMAMIVVAQALWFIGAGAQLLRS